MAVAVAGGDTPPLGAAKGLPVVAQPAHARHTADAAATAQPLTRAETGNLLIIASPK